MREVGNEFSGKLYPSGEFGIVRNRAVEADRYSQRQKTEDEIWAIQRLAVHGLQECLDFAHNDGSVEGVPQLCEGESGVDTLGLSLHSNSHKAVRGMNGITSHGKKYVRSAASLLEHKYFKENLSFLTLTVPSLSQADWKELCGGWSEVVRQYLQWLSRKLRSFGLCDCIVSVTEIQEERQSRTLEPALHLHLLFQGRKNREGWKITPKTFRDAWERVVRNVCKNIPKSTSFSSSEEVRRVKKSAVGYLGKYMSKGVSAIGEMRIRNANVVLPHTWWNMTKSMRDWVKRSILVLPQEVCEMLMNGYFVEDRRMIEWSKKIKVEIGEGFTLTVGMMGRCSKEFAEFIKTLKQNSVELKRYRYQG